MTQGQVNDAKRRRGIINKKSILVRAVTVFVLPLVVVGMAEGATSAYKKISHEGT